MKTLNKEIKVEVRQNKGYGKVIVITSTITNYGKVIVK